MKSAIRNWTWRLHYKITPTTEISYVYRIGVVTNNYQRGNRIRLGWGKDPAACSRIKGIGFYHKSILHQ